KQHTLHITGHDTTALILADPLRIAQVLVNLVGNSVKFSPPGTTITLSAQLCGGFVRVDVSDEGSGIPVNAHEIVFEAFRQLDRADHAQSRGAGLGLAICKGLVEAHGGKIWVQHRETPGTTISFTLPVAPA
ncbi:MAG: ATP-binding protein, partial [bacterium]|nr:ATP-binding protein [bacterium]